jgi:hypothetical protein
MASWYVLVLVFHFGMSGITSLKIPNYNTKASCETAAKESHADDYSCVPQDHFEQ